MKLLILSRAPYDDEQAKTRPTNQTIDTHGRGVVSSYTREHTQDIQVLTSQVEAPVLMSTGTNMNNHSSVLHGSAKHTNNMQTAHDNVCIGTQTRPFSAEAPDSFPLDLSGFNKTNVSLHCSSHERLRNSESPLDLSVKTRKTVADSTNFNGVNSTLSGPILNVNHNFSNVKINQTSSIVETNNITASQSTNIDDIPEYYRSRLKEEYRMYTPSRYFKRDEQQLYSAPYSDCLQFPVADTVVFSSSGGSTRKGTYYDQLSTHTAVSSTHHKDYNIDSERQDCFIDKAADLKRKLTLQNRSVNDMHLLRVSPHALATLSPSLPNSPHSAAVSPYLIPNSPRGAFSLPTSPASSGHNGFPKRIPVLHELENKIGDTGYDRSQVVQSSVSALNPSGLYPVKAYTPPSLSADSKTPLSRDTRLHINGGKYKSHLKHNNPYFSHAQTYDRELRLTKGDVAMIAGVEASCSNRKPPESQSPPTLSMVSPVMKAVNDTPPSPVLTMPVLSPHNKTPPGKTWFPPSGPPPLISFTHQPNHKGLTKDKLNHQISTAQFDHYKRHPVKENKNDQISVSHTSKDTMNMGYGFNERICQKSKDAIRIEYDHSDGNRQVQVGDHTRMNPIQQRILAEYSETYRQQLWMRYVSQTENRRQNDITEQSPSTKESFHDVSRLGNMTLRHSSRKRHFDTLNTITESGKNDILSRPRNYTTSDHTTSHTVNNMNIAYDSVAQEYITRNEGKSIKITQTECSKHTSPFNVDIYDPTNYSIQTSQNSSLPNQINNKTHAHKRACSSGPSDKLNHEPPKDLKYLLEHDSCTRKTEIGSLCLPFMIYGQVLLSETKADSNHQYLKTASTDKHTCKQESNRKDWNNSTIDLTESDVLIPESVETTGKTKCVSRYSSAVEKTYVQDDGDRNICHSVDTEHNDGRDILDYHIPDSQSTIKSQMKNDISAVPIPDKFKKRFPEKSAMSCNSVCDEAIITSADTSGYLTTDNSERNTQAPLHCQSENDIKEHVRENKTTDSEVVFYPSAVRKGSSRNSRVSVKCSSEYKKMCPLMKKISLSLEKEMQRRTTGINSRSRIAKSKLIRSEIKSNHADVIKTDLAPRLDGNPDIALGGHCNTELAPCVDGDRSMENPDAFDFCGSENEASPDDQPRFRSVKRYISKKRTYIGISYDGENSVEQQSEFGQDVSVPGRDDEERMSPKKQKKLKKNDVYKQSKNIGRRKRKYQIKKTSLKSRLSAYEERSLDSKESLDGRRPRKRYHKNEAYEEELVREERRKAMLRARRRQRQETYSPYTSKNTPKDQESKYVVCGKINILRRKRLGRPPKKQTKFIVDSGSEERRRIGRPPKSTTRPDFFKSRSKLTEKLKRNKKNSSLKHCKNHINQNNCNPNLNGSDCHVDHLLVQENIALEGVSDDVFLLPAHVKGENKEDSDFADDATIIYDMSDSPEAAYQAEDIAAETLTTSGTLMIPPDLKRLQVNKNVGETVLHRAARLGYEDVIVYCQEMQLIDVNIRDHGGYTPLHESCVRGNLNVAKCLIAYGANVNSSAQDGTRPIHDAIACNRVEMVRLLLSRGADPTLATYSGRTCSTIAHTREMTEFLQGYESDINGGEVEEVFWEFHSSSVLENTSSQGFDIFGDVPSDYDIMEEEPHFDSSSQAHLPAYTLQLEADKGSSNYHLLRDVLNNMQMNRNEFFNLCGNVSNVTVTCDVFNRHVKDSQLLSSPWSNSSGDDTNHNIKYVELVRLNDNLRKHLCITKDSWWTKLSPKGHYESLNDSILSDLSINESVSGDLYQMHNQSRDSYLSPFCDYLDTPEMEAEVSYTKSEHRLANKTVSIATVHLDSPPGDTVQINTNDVRVERETPYGDRSFDAESVTPSVLTNKRITHTGGSTSSISPIKGLTLKMANASGCFPDTNVSRSDNRTGDRHRSSPATGEDACTLKVAQECIMRDNLIVTKFQAQQPTHSAQQKHQ